MRFELSIEYLPPRLAYRRWHATIEAAEAEVARVYQQLAAWGHPIGQYWEVCDGDGRIVANTRKWLAMDQRMGRNRPDEEVPDPRSYQLEGVLQHYFPCRRCGEAPHCACYHGACCYCGSKGHRGAAAEHDFKWEDP